MDTIELKNIIDKYLQEYFVEKGTYNKVLYDSMSYSLNIGGKRIRPILMMMAYDMYKGNSEDILPMASAIEMIHTYSLIHDDLPSMDNDELRRGKPTNHTVFGEAIAILAGDGLLNEAMNVMIDYSLSHGKEALMALKIISNAAGGDGMIGGQIVDISSEGRDISVEELNYMHRKKTGALIKAAILSGAVLANAPKNDIEILDEFGEKLGLAFQIKDDILDVIGDEKKLGKRTHMDKEADKNNYISFYGLEKCEEMCKQLTEECLTLLKNLSEDGSKIMEMTKLLLNREN